MPYAVNPVPRPRSLTAAQLGTAALAVIDRDGAGALTMRAVARELGVSTMGLYRYVADRAEMECLVVEHVLAAVDTTRSPGRSWRAQIETLVERLRQALGGHPGVVPLTLVHRQSSPTIARWSETMLDVLSAAGIDGRRRVIALRAVLGYVIGAVQLEHLGPLTGPGTAAFAELPADQFPLLVATARSAERIGPAEEFRGGLRLLLAGLEQP